MSLFVDIDKVSSVLLADGWHKVQWEDGTRLVPPCDKAAREPCRQSTFHLDSYEYVDRDEFEYDMAGSAPLVLNTAVSRDTAGGREVATCWTLIH